MRPTTLAPALACGCMLALAGCRRADAARERSGAVIAPPAPSPSIEPHAEEAPPIPRLDPNAALPDPCTTSPSIVLGPRTLDAGDGRDRTVVLDAPADAAPHPLLLAFHGWGGSPEQMERTTKIAEAATARGFVVARPLGVGKSFNAGTCCGAATEQEVDDVAFARALVAAIAKETCIDRTRVFATGFSNGGFLSHRLACEASDVFAAVASVGGTFGVVSCAPPRAVPVLQIHGLADPIVKYAGTEAKGWSSVADVIATWSRIDACARTPRETFHNGGAKCVTYDQCAPGGEVALCTVEKAGHTWPGGPKSTGKGGTQELDATTMILDFFARHGG